jgi:hypothetical protein
VPTSGNFAWTSQRLSPQALHPLLGDMQTLQKDEKAWKIPSIHGMNGAFSSFSSGFLSP